MSLTPFDYVKCINAKEYPSSFEGYSQWMVNKVFSCHSEYYVLATEMSKQMSDREHFDFYYYLLPKNPKLYIPYLCKKEKTEKDIQYLMEYYQINQTTAKQYLKLISDEDMKTVRGYFENRGLKK